MSADISSRHAGDIHVIELVRGRNHATSVNPTRRFQPGAQALKHAILTSLPLGVADVSTVLAAMLIATEVVFLGGFAETSSIAGILLPLVGSLLIIFASIGLYPGVGMNPIVELRLISWSSTLAFGVCIVASRLGASSAAGATLALLIAWPIALVILPLSRSATRWIFATHEWWGQRVLIFGGGPAALSAYRHLKNHPAHGLRPVGVVDDYETSDALRQEGCFLGPTSAGADIAMRKEVSWAMVVMPERSRQEIMHVVSRHAANFPHLLVAANMEGLPTLWTSGRECGGLPGLQVNERLLLPIPQIMKRLMDLALIILSAPLLLPLMAIVVILIKRSSPGPVFYCQQRIGRDRQPFFAWKFRSMVQNADAALAKYLADNPAYQEEWNRDHKLRHDPRITAIGRFLRKTSLDELPQLWNVLRGEMSLVGPRPIVDAEISKYAESFDLYTKVTPGITGMWQISGRNDTTYRQRVEFDTFYARNWSPFLDIYILARTIKVVLLREGAY